MVKYIEDFITAPTPKGATSNCPRSYEDAVYNKLKDKFPLIIFSCVQLANKLSLHSHASSALPMITYVSYPEIANRIILHNSSTPFADD